MKRLSFRKFTEATDIFGFDAKRSEEDPSEKEETKPINQFNLELMMNFLSKKSIGLHEGEVKYVNEIQWGHQPGSVKLKVDTGYTFYVKRLGVDLEGNETWATKRMFQLNRHGYGGLEDSVAQEIFEHLERYYNARLDTPDGDYEDLENLVVHISNKLKRTSKSIFLYEGIKKVDDDNYIIIFAIHGHGVEAPGHMRVEENLTNVIYSPDKGIIHIVNYNVESPVGGPHSWSLTPLDLQVSFFPSQSREEISEAVSVHFKFY